MMFMVIGSFFLIGFTKMITFVSNSLYDRQAIEGLMDSLIGQRNISQAIIDEVMIVTYEYNSQAPRLFSKYWANWNPSLYEVKYSIACGGSSAAPGYFTPQKRINGYYQTELMIDGGVIANNPALLSYMHARHIMRHPYIRMLSLGTGIKPPRTYDIDNWNPIDFITQIQPDLIVDVETMTSEFIVHSIMSSQPKKNKNNYLRAQCETSLPLDKTDDASISALISEGEKLWQENAEQAKLLIKSIVDEKFGYLLVKNGKGK